MRFDMICEANGIEHRLTKPNHSWTNGQVERMNRTIKEGPSDASIMTATTSCAPTSPTSWRHTTSPDASRRSAVSPYEHICKVWTSEPDRFILDPIHQMPGLKT
jgi:transposase InsO family protein